MTVVFLLETEKLRPKQGTDSPPPPSPQQVPKHGTIHATILEMHSSVCSLKTSRDRYAFFSFITKCARIYLEGIFHCPAHPMTSPQWGSASGPHAQLEGQKRRSSRRACCIQEDAFLLLPHGVTTAAREIQCLSSSLGWWFGWHFMLQKKLKTVLASAASYTNLFPHPMRMES